MFITVAKAHHSTSSRHFCCVFVIFVWHFRCKGWENESKHEECSTIELVVRFFPFFYGKANCCYMKEEIWH